MIAVILVDLIGSVKVLALAAQRREYVLKQLG
jgi:hypothetical protein